MSLHVQPAVTCCGRDGLIRTRPSTSPPGGVPGWLAFTVFAVVTLVLFKSPVTVNADAGYSVHLAVSLLQEGDFDLDEYRHLVPEGDLRVIEVNGRLVSRYPVWPSVVVSPGVAFLKTFLRRTVSLRLEPWLEEGGNPGGIEKFFASLLVAGAACLLLHLARRELPLSGALLAVFVFVFCTSAWSSVSRALWQHAPSLVFVFATLGILTGRRERSLPLAGLFVALAYAVRPTNALLVLAVTAHVALAHRRRLWPYLRWAGLVAAFFVIQSVWDYGTLLPPYNDPDQVGAVSLGAFSEGLAGTLLSPGRGLFVYSPVLLFALWGVAIRLRRLENRQLHAFLALVLLGHWLLISSWFSWWGGSVYGPRLFADVLPILLYFMLPPIGVLFRAPWRRPFLALAFVLAAGWSFALHQRGAYRTAAWDWNILPPHEDRIPPPDDAAFWQGTIHEWDVDEHPERLWDWRDPPFSR